MWDWINKVNELKLKNEEFLIATITESKGSTPREGGAKMIIKPDGTFFGTIGGGLIEKLVLKDAQDFFKDGVTKVFNYPLSKEEGHLCGGHVSVLMEVIGNLPNVYIFGAGHVGQALCKTLNETPFNIHLVDERDEWINSKELPSSIIKHACTDEEFIEKASWEKNNTYVVIVTPGHAKDEKVLEQLLKKEIKLLGMIGSNRKWKEIQKHLIEKKYDEDLFKKVSCPVGLIKAGKAPKEIAISIAAQIIQKHYA